MKCLVIGNNWSATLLVAQAIRDDVQVLWFLGSHNAVQPPLNVVKDMAQAQSFCDLCSYFGITLTCSMQGGGLKEFKKHGLSHPAWYDTPDNPIDSSHSQSSLKDEVYSGWFTPLDAVWIPQAPIIFSTPLHTIFAQLRECVMQHERVRVEDTVWIQKIECFAHEVVVTASDMSCQTVDYAYFCDSLGELSKLQGLPRPLDFLRNQEPYGLLQVEYRHSEAVFAEDVNMYMECLKDVPKKNAKNTLATPRYAMVVLDPKTNQSCWSLCLNHQESMDNHEIYKKLRKIKQLAEKIYRITHPDAVTDVLQEIVVRCEPELGLLRQKQALMGNIMQRFFVFSDGAGVLSVLSNKRYGLVVSESPLGLC